MKRGVMWGSIGHWEKSRKREELWSEETLYLMERGNLQVLVKENEGEREFSVQEAFVKILGEDEDALERYQARSSWLCMRSCSCYQFSSYRFTRI
jgi:tRNA splicing endonuclease